MGDLNKGRPLNVNLLQTLDNLLKSYVETSHLDILVNEVIANGYDAIRENSVKNGIISINLKCTESEHHYIEFHNNAPPMSEEQFIKKYHTLSESTKTLGDGIGYAGVGAKLFTASKYGGEIITITGTERNDFLASKMYVEDSNVMYKTSHDVPLNDILDYQNYTHKYGTTYRAKLTPSAYRELKEKLPKIIQKWWNYSLLTKKITIKIDGKKLFPWEPKNAKKFRQTFTWRGEKIPTLCYISEDKVPEDLRHIVLTVYGKRVEKNELDNPVEIKEDYAHRVFCVADVTFLGKHLRLNKESFEKNAETSKCRNRIKECFWKFLEENGLLAKHTKRNTDTLVVVNELTKKLNSLLNKKEFIDLNPFLNPRNRAVPTKDPDGPFPVSENPGEGPSSDTNSGGNGDGKSNTTGNEAGTSVVKDDSGKDSGSIKTKKAKGLQIIPAFDIKNHNDEAFVDLLRGGVVVDMTHPFFVLCSKNPTLQDFNLNRILIEALIKFKNNEVDWDATQTLNRFRDLFHASWK